MAPPIEPAPKSRPASARPASALRLTPKPILVAERTGALTPDPFSIPDTTSDVPTTTSRVFLHSSSSDTPPPINPPTRHPLQKKPKKRVQIGKLEPLERAETKESLGSLGSAGLDRPLSKVFVEAEIEEDPESEGDLGASMKSRRKRPPRRIGYAGVVRMSQVEEAAKNRVIVSFLERYREKKRMRDLAEAPSSFSSEGIEEIRSSPLPTVEARPEGRRHMGRRQSRTLVQPKSFSDVVLKAAHRDQPLRKTPSQTSMGSWTQFLKGEMPRNVIGLVFLALWTLAGALAFPLLEAKEEERLTELWHAQNNDTSRRTALNYTALVLGCHSECLSRREEGREDGACLEECALVLAERVRQAQLELTQRDSDRSVFKPTAKPLWAQGSWQRRLLYGAYYCVSVYSTIGYGDMVCRSFWGRLLTILYALIGIPSCFVVLTGIGQLIQGAVLKVTTLILEAKIRLQHRFSAKTFPAVPKKRKSSAEVPLLVILCLLSSYLFCSAGLIYWAEEGRLDYFDALYFNFISLSTIGFGDLLPESAFSIGVTLGTLLMGLATVGMCIANIQTGLEDRYMDAMNLMEEAYELGSTILEEVSSYWDPEDKPELDIELANQRLAEQSLPGDPPPSTSHDTSSRTRVTQHNILVDTSTSNESPSNFHQPPRTPDKIK